MFGKMLIISFLFGGLFTTSVAAVRSEKSDKGRLPVLKSANCHISEIAIRDPYIYADTVTQMYYLYSATRLAPERPNGRHGVKVYRSRDLRTWEGPKLVYEVPSDSWIDFTHGVWAPEMHFYKGKYYLFATFTNEKKALKQVEGRPFLHRRATQILVASSPEGPFQVIGEDKPQTPDTWMALDGTLWEEDGKPYMVFCHEWTQIENGTVEAALLSEDLSDALSSPCTLFRACDASWVRSLNSYKNRPATGYITDGCFLHHLPSGKLLMLWSSFGEKGYAVSTALSESGRLCGPWKHRTEPLYKKHGGHAMLFRTFEGQLMMVLHYPNSGTEPHSRFFELRETENDIEIIKEFIP